MIVAVIALRSVSLSTRHYMKGVADFLSANRSAGRYLLTIASQMGGIGVVTFVAMFEMTYGAGLSPGWWQMMLIPVNVIILLTGWVFYRFRETRALTMAQFFEMRYNRRFRVFAGIICWVSGILNFGVFPAVAARFFVYFCGLRDVIAIPGTPLHLPTFVLVMAIDLSLALWFVLMGGQISVMITECVQGMFCVVAFVVVSATILVKVSWSKMVLALSMAPANQSMINPFHTSGVKDFNVWYFVIAVFGGFYGYMSWQGTSGFYSSARTPHEQKMGGIIGVWRQVPQNLMGLLLPLAAIAILKLHDYSSVAATVNHQLSHISSTAIQGQMRVPIALAQILPIGVKGLLATIMLFLSFTCHDTYMHSWGSIFVQDVLMPIRKKAMSPEQHIKLLRWSIFGVALFAFIFSWLYQPTQKIYMFFAITGTIWLAGSGAVIIGGLYWKKGTTAGAYSALIIGAIIGVGGLFIRWWWQTHLHRDFPLNDQEIFAVGMACAAISYALVSLATCRRDFNLEKMLCRGVYAKNCDPLPVDQPRSKWLQITGITHEFSKSDKILASALVIWNLLNFAFFVIFSLWNLITRNVPDSAWLKWWHFNIIWQLVVSIPVIVWFTVGGLIDIKALFHMLANEDRDATDNGTVRSELDDVEPVAAVNAERTKDESRV